MICFAWREESLLSYAEEIYSKGLSKSGMEIRVQFTDVYNDLISRLRFTNEAVKSTMTRYVHCTCEFLGHEVSIQFRLSNEKV